MMKKTQKKQTSHVDFFNQDTVEWEKKKEIILQ